MVNIQKINSMLSENISNVLEVNEDYPIKRFVINSIENATFAKERGKFFNYYYGNDHRNPLEAFKINASITIVRNTDNNEISLENIDFIWLADTIDNKGNYTWRFGKQLADHDFIWPANPPETKLDVDKATKTFMKALTDLYIENYFTHIRQTEEAGIVYYFIYQFHKMFFKPEGSKCEENNYPNSIMLDDWQVIYNLINQ